MGLLAIAQVVGGVLLCYTGIGAPLGMIMIQSGIKDGLVAIQMIKDGTDGFSWDKYISEKAAYYALGIFENIHSSLMGMVPINISNQPKSDILKPIIENQDNENFLVDIIIKIAL